MLTGTSSSDMFMLTGTTSTIGRMLDYTYFMLTGTHKHSKVGKSGKLNRYYVDWHPQTQYG